MSSGLSLLRLNFGLANCSAQNVARACARDFARGSLAFTIFPILHLLTWVSHPPVVSATAEGDGKDTAHSAHEQFIF